MKFIADATLGKLVKWLRIFGYDTLFYRKSDLDSLIKIAKKENRIILTKNTKFKKKRIADKYLFIHKIRPLEQLKEVIDSYKLKKDNMFKLCTVCNRQVIPADKKEIIDRVPEFVSFNIDNFTLCPHCKRVYWSGTHRERMIKKILSIINNKKEGMIKS
ncbi:MAG TPA: Mut7-C RNAse domain-containing protein [Nitrospinota bacterium]|nr:Mut7-C RNAse domain-containing protein [Nitrospinota bacterium]